MIDQVIGIYLGINHISLGIWEKGEVKIIPNEFGNTKTPLIISFKENEIIIGEKAKDELTKSPKNTIYKIMKLIGRKFDEPEIEELINTLPYKIEKDPNSNRVMINIEYFGKNY